MILNNQQSSEWTLATKVFFLALTLLAASNILGGPLGIFVRGERHALLVLLVLAAIQLFRHTRSTLVKELILDNRVILLPVAFVIANCFWLLPLDNFSSATLAFGLTDIQSLVLLPIASLALVATWKYRDYYIKVAQIILILCVVLSAIQVSIWLILRFTAISQDTVNVYLELYFRDSDSVTILRQPSFYGEYVRIFWISNYWVLVAAFILPVLVRRPLFVIPLQTLFFLEILASYTKGIWLGFIVASFVLSGALIILHRLKRNVAPARPWKLSVIGFIVAISMTIFLDFIQDKPKILLARIITVETQSSIFGNTDESSNERREQARALMEKWKDRPLLGYGYGAFLADHIRHDDRPFIYEMLPFSMLFKLGAIGFSLHILFMGYILVRLAMLSRFFSSAPYLLSSSVGFFLATYTNPVLFSFGCMLIFSLLVVAWLALEIQLPNNDLSKT